MANIILRLRLYFPSPSHSRHRVDKACLVSTSSPEPPLRVDFS
ncbi:hypothetical protein [Desulforhopalus vacuolatus]|nr:hypothetical protein [Desulforhopalus vacuolatus]